MHPVFINKPWILIMKIQGLFIKGDYLFTTYFS